MSYETLCSNVKKRANIIMLLRCNFKSRIKLNESNPSMSNMIHLEKKSKTQNLTFALLEVKNYHD